MLCWLVFIGWALVMGILFWLFGFSRLGLPFMVLILGFSLLLTPGFPVHKFGLHAIRQHCLAPLGPFTSPPPHDTVLYAHHFVIVSPYSIPLNYRVLSSLGRLSRASLALLAVQYLLGLLAAIAVHL